MFWLGLLVGAWCGFLLGMVFLAAWVHARQPEDLVMDAEMLEWSEATLAAQAEAVSSTADSYVSLADLHAIAAIRDAQIDRARGRYTT